MATYNALTSYPLQQDNFESHELSITVYRDVGSFYRV